MFMGLKQLSEKPISEKLKEDEELLQIVEKIKTKIKVVGAGGAGNNTITRLMQVGITGAETIAVNTDAQDLLYTDAHKKVLIGKETTCGLGAGANPKIGMEAAKENKEDIKKALQGADLVFLTAGLGGGCLTGDSLIYTNPEGPVRIDSIQPNSFVYSLENGTIVKRRVLAAMKTGIKRTFEIRTRNYKLKASYDHPFLRVVPLNPDKSGRFSQFKLEWSQAESLKPGDLVVTLRKVPEIRSSSEFFKFFEFSKIESVEEIGEKEVYDITVEGSHNFIAEGFVVHNTGTGSLPVIAEVAKKLGALTVAIVTLPFSMEGRQRMLNAKEGLENLRNVTDTLIVIPNDKLLEIVPDVSIATAFKVCDEILVNAVKGITELVTKPGLVNLDFADLRAIMQSGGLAMIGMGESDTENRAIEAVEKALNNPLLSVDIDGATGALIDVIGGPDITIRESQQIAEAIASRLSPDAKIIWGVQIDKSLEDTIKALVVVTGIKSHQVFGGKGSKEKDIEKILGIDFVEE
jgi:cell division protein FtsZ